MLCEAGVMVALALVLGLTSKVFELDDGVEAFAAQLTGKYPKILIRCNPDID